MVTRRKQAARVSRSTDAVRLAKESAPTPTTLTGRDLIDAMTDSLLTQLPEIDGTQQKFTMRVARLTLMLEEELGDRLGRWGLTRAEFGVLRALRAIGEPYELRPTDLKARILLTSGGTTNVLNRLVASGLIERERDDTDGRSSWVRLTQKGLVTAEETIVSWSQAQSDIYRGVPPETMQVAADALREVLLAIGDHDLPAPNSRDSDRSRGRRASAGRDAARAAARTRTPSSPD